MRPGAMQGFMGEISEHNYAVPVDGGYPGTSPRQSDGGYFNRRPGSGGQLNQHPNQWTSGKARSCLYSAARRVMNNARAHFLAK